MSLESLFLKMNIKKSNTYLRDISKLKIDISSGINKALILFEENMQHPSLHNKHIQCKRAHNLYSIRVNKQYRILYRLLNHDKYDRLTRSC